MGHTLDIRFEGDRFYPTKLKEQIDLPIEILAEYGKAASKGRYKGVPSPYGLALLELKVFNNDINGLLEHYILKLEENKMVLAGCGVEAVIFDLGDSKETPLEIAIPNQLMQKLVSINGSIEVHTIEKIYSQE